MDVFQAFHGGLVVIDNLHAFRVMVRRPAEADAPLVIDPDAILSAPVSLQSLKTVSRRDPEVIQPRCGIKKHQFAPGGAFKTTKCSDELIVEQPFRVPIGKASDHEPSYAVISIPSSGYGC